jgi:hypothetical protein
MTLEELRKIKNSQSVYYNGNVAYLYVFGDRGYYLFSNDPSLNGSDPCPIVRSSLGYSYSYWLASKDDYDHCNRHVDIMIAKKGRRPL